MARDLSLEKLVYHNIRSWQFRPYYLDFNAVCPHCEIPLDCGQYAWRSRDKRPGGDYQAYHIWLHNDCYEGIASLAFDEEYLIGHDYFDGEGDKVSKKKKPKKSTQLTIVEDLEDEDELFTTGYSTQDRGVWLSDLEKIIENFNEVWPKLQEMTLSNQIKGPLTRISDTLRLVERGVAQARGRLQYGKTSSYSYSSCRSRTSAFKCGDCDEYLCQDNLCTTHKHILEHFAETGHTVCKAIQEERKEKQCLTIN